MFWNPSEHLVITDHSLTKAKLLELAESSFCEGVATDIDWLLSRRKRQTGLTVCDLLRVDVQTRTTFVLPSLQAFDKPLYKNALGRVMWSKIADDLEQCFSNELERSNALIAAMATAAINGEEVFAATQAVGLPCVHLRNRKLVELIDSSDSVEEALGNLATVRQFAWNDKKEGAGQLHPIAECLRALSKCWPDVDPHEKESHRIRCRQLATASTSLLLILVEQDRILLDVEATGFGPMLSRRIDAWKLGTNTPGELALLRALLVTTTVKTIDDLPASPRDWIQEHKFEQSFHGLVAPLIEVRQHKDPTLKKFPVANLNKVFLQQIAVSNGVWSPAQIRATHGEAWARFAEIFDLRSDAAIRERDIALRHFMPWVAARNFEDPSNIRPRDLLDPTADPERPTYQYWLAEREWNGKPIATKGLKGIWASTSRAFELVANHLKVDPDSILSLASNPFEALENPFPSAHVARTTRHRLPGTLHEVLMEVLLDLDDAGNPTYEWALKACPDQFTWTAPSTGEKVEVACPSRAACLALLLALPLRGKQARWLDRGLMDVQTWDADSRSMRDNLHALADWRYPNGETHLQRFGRNSGAIQMGAESFMGPPEVAIYVNTNKAQMWDREAHRGYELPWPRVTNDHLEVTESLRNWINRPYLILEQHLKWVAKFLPNPVPVSYSDSPTERAGVNPKNFNDLPAFCPAFADMSAKAYKADRSTEIYMPISKAKIVRLFEALCLEAETRLTAEGRDVRLTQTAPSRLGYTSLFDIHSLRVSGVSKLIEAGVPVSIVQEFIVGHRGAVMTLRYNKPDINVARHQIAQGVSRSLENEDWRSQAESLSQRQDLWAHNGDLAPHRPQALIRNFAGWTSVPGGICPLGGQGCDEGGVNQQADAEGPVTYGPVKGGCGNCRFFSTGPIFLVQQALMMNEIMLELRMLGRTRRNASDELTALSWQDVPGLDDDGRMRIRKSILDAKETIAALDLKSEPLVLEWVNRYKMHAESTRLVEESLEHQTKRPHKGSPANKLALISAATTEEIQPRYVTQLEKAGDFTLVRNIAELADIQGGPAKASALSREMLHMFVDRILRTEGSRALVTDIGDERMRHEVARVIASGSELLFGRSALDDATRTGHRMASSDDQRRQFLEWVEQAIQNPAMTISNAQPRGAPNPGIAASEASTR